jgi:formate dehydrogenase
MNTLYRNEKWIAAHMPENTLTMHADDAAELGIADKERVRLLSRQASAEIPVSLTTDILPGTVYLSHGWGLYSRDPEDLSGKLRGVAASLFVPDEDGDEFTGMPHYNGIPCAVIKLDGTDTA